VFNAAIDDWDEHLAKLKAFSSSVMLTSGRYKGNPMAAHMRQPIEPPFFGRWLELWRETVTELFVPAVADRFAEKAERIGESLKLAVFFRPEPRRLRELLHHQRLSKIAPGKGECVLDAVGFRVELKHRRVL
jgi:hemoglobin